MKDKVYYDDKCYVCSFEINAVRKRGEACGIEFVDISDEDFDLDGDTTQRWSESLKVSKP